MIYFGTKLASLSVTAARNAGLVNWRRPDNYKIIGRGTDNRQIILVPDCCEKHFHAPVFRGFLVPDKAAYSTLDAGEAEEIYIKFQPSNNHRSWLEKETRTLLSLNDIPRLPRVAATGEADVVYVPPALYSDNPNDNYVCCKMPPPFLAITPVRGKKMSTLIKSSIKIPPGREKLAWIIGDALTGTSELLAKIHDRGIIHRDLKPDHIILDREDGTIGLIDFGSSTRIADRPINGHFGTLAFFPPEYVFEPPEKEDPRIDAYSIGSTAFTLASGGGHIHYGEGLPVDTVYNFIENIWAYRSAGVAELIKASNLPAELKETSFARYIFQLMHPDINQRPINMREIADNFRRIGAELG